MKVSIIIPVYNVAPYIERCIKSVMNQAYRDIECILVNDASPDDSIDIAKRLIADYKGSIQFRILSHKQNKGVSAARNTGINAATGEYICFVDSDDEITPDCIEKLSQPILNDPTIEMVEGCHVIIWKDRDNVVSKLPFLKPQLEFKTQKAVRDFYFSRQFENKNPVNKLVNRDFLLKNKLYFKEGIYWEDFLWHFYYNKYVSHLYIIPDITYNYFKRPNSTTTSANKKITDHYFEIIYADVINNFSPNDCIREAKYFFKGFSLFYLNANINPVLKKVACQYLNVLKVNHCIKEWIFLKCIIVFSCCTFVKKIIRNALNLFKSIRTKKYKDLKL